MLSLFPDLLVYSMLSPLIIRVVAATIFIDLGALAFKKEKERWIISLRAINLPKPELLVKILGLIEIVGGIMLFIGLYTQLAALVLGLLTLAEGYIEYKDPALLKRNIVFYIMLFALTISLLFSGPGAFSFDLPL
jgi:putative oxidoreductase